VRRRKLQVLVAALLLAGGMLVSARIDHGEAITDAPIAGRSALDPPSLTIRHRPGRLSLEGTAASSRHEAELRQVATEQFGDVETETRFNAGVLLPDSWETASLRLLYAIAALDSAQAQLSPGEIEIRGVTTDPAMLDSRLDFLRESIDPSVAIREEVLVVEATAPLAALCRRNLAHATTEQVAFRQSSSEIRTSSFAILDRLVDLANDCRGNVLAITGHSDGTGPETWNRQLSLNRAQVVADYLAERGVPADSLLVTGVGSSEPIADNATAHGRSLNRRIEFELR
jgi:OOP family OmpA-OmpF porin